MVKLLATAKITSSGNLSEKRWIRFSYASSLSVHHTTEAISFTRKEQQRVKEDLQKIDKYSLKSAKLRRMKKTKQMRKVNVATRNTLLKLGRRLFRVLKKVYQVQASTFEDLFGEDLDLTLTVDFATRKFPWELAHDGQGFLCTKYDMGRKLETSFWERKSGYTPEHRKALVVGLNYRWEKDKDKWLYTSEREALVVKRQLEKKGYKVKLLGGKGDEATLEEVKRNLSEGVSIFHFSGHGAYKVHQQEGRRGALVLRDGDLTEDDFKACFDKAKGAPYLSFLNACQSAKEIYSSHLMDAFVEYGAEFVIGTFWSVYDQPSTSFSERFYREITSETPIGHALNLARWQLINKRSLAEITTWPSFVLYGSPVHSLPKAP